MGLLGRSESAVDPAARDKYLLQVTAGPTYSQNTHSQVSVNSSNVHVIDNSLATTYLRVRIRDYHGLPRNSPGNCSYFSHPLHTSDRYSVAWSFVPKNDISGTDLIMGFDFSHPVRDRLPPGTKTAVKIATTVLDPGLYADPYSDEPYLYGPALSSFFAFRIGGMMEEESIEEQLKRLGEEGVVEEGASFSGESIRSGQEIPGSWKARRKFFLDQSQLEKFTFEKGRMYHADFFNPYLDFSTFSLRLPGFSISVAKYVDEKTHHLRFVLKSRESGDVLFVVFFKLLFGKELEGTLRNSEEGEDRKIDSEMRTVSTKPVDGPKQKLEAKTEESVAKFKQQEILGGSRAPSVQEPKGFAPPKPFTRKDECDYALNAVVNSLAQSISAAFCAMGFGTLSMLPEPEACSDGSISPRVHAEPVDDIEDRAVESYLRDRHGSTR